jgi:Zn-dependent membrane protease YugP
MHAAVFFPLVTVPLELEVIHRSPYFLKNGHFKMLMIRSRSSNGG